MQFIPTYLQNLWNEWDLRVMVLVSLSLQIILIGFGNRRKYIASNWIRMILWLAYLSADWVATVSLGILSNNDLSDSKYVIMALWAPFLLLHLGGPDTITAYSLEDNELWLRHFLGLVIQVGVALYIFLRSLEPTKLNLVAIPVFVAGIVKYGERTWVLWSASCQHFRKSLLPHPDPGPNYAKFMEEYILKETEGFELSWTAIQAPKGVAHTNTFRENDLIPDATSLNAAYDFFKTYKRLFADLILSFQDLEKSQSFFQNCSSVEAFKVIEIELGFVYDVLYTKATVFHSLRGCFLRLMSISSTIIALTAFSVVDKKAFSVDNKCYNINVSITYLLLIGAIGLDIYAILLLLSSDWTMLYISKQENLPVNLIYKVISSFKFLTSSNRWSNYMEQHNLINSCFKDKPAKYSGVLKGTCIHKIIENHGHETPELVRPCLKEHIFQELVEKSRGASDFRVCKNLCACRGEQVLRKNDCLDKLGWSLEVEFDHCILLWHIATDICYSSDHKRGQDHFLNPKCTMSKLLSDYMLYILVNRPFMLPNGIGQIRFQDTIAEAMEFIRERKSISNASLACERLLQVDTRIPPAEVKGDRSKSVLFDACRLAKSLQSLQVEEKWPTQKKWEMISHVWVEMLSYAASQCRWNHHAQQLRQGGELLTHVWLLMAHLGLTEQFQISQGHARAKLVVK